MFIFKWYTRCGSGYLIHIGSYRGYTKVKQMDTQVSISKIRKSLLDSRNTLLESIDSFREEIHKYELANPDSDDLAQVYTLRQQNFSYINEAEEKLKRIESALKRIEQGTYGKCQRCGFLYGWVVYF